MPVGLIFGGTVAKRGKKAVDNFGNDPFGTIGSGAIGLGGIGTIGGLGVRAGAQATGIGKKRSEPASGPSKESQNALSDAEMMAKQETLGGLRGSLMESYGFDLTGGVRGGVARNPNLYGQASMRGGIDFSNRRISRAAEKWYYDSKGRGPDPIGQYNNEMRNNIPGSFGPRSSTGQATQGPAQSPSGARPGLSREELERQITARRGAGQRGPLDPLDPRYGELVRKGIELGYINSRGEWV